MMEPQYLRTVELFCGIGGFRIASDRLGLNTIWANDISKEAVKIYADRFGNDCIQHGDIANLIENIPQHDVLTAGFPCQPFSSAGKKLGIKDSRGTLFHNIIEIVNKFKPNLFILENVKRLLSMDKGNHFATILSELSNLGYLIEWRLINASDLGLPQNRQRVFIVGYKNSTEVDHTKKVNLVSKNDLSDFLQVKYSDFINTKKWDLISSHKKRFPTWGMAHKGHFIASDINKFSDRQPSIYLRSVLQKEDEVPPNFDFTDSTLEWIEENTEVNKFIGGVKIISNQRGGARMGYTIFGTDGLAPTLTSTTSRHYERYKIEHRYRRLTNIEYARIQGFPDNHCKEVSVYNQYPLYGNAVPPPMAEWVLRKALEENNIGLIAPQHTQYKLQFEA